MFWKFQKCERNYLKSRPKAWKNTSENVLFGKNVGLPSTKLLQNKPFYRYFELKACNFTTIALHHGCSLVIFQKIFRTAFLQYTHWCLCIDQGFSWHNPNIYFTKRYLRLLEQSLHDENINDFNKEKKFTYSHTNFRNLETFYFVL